MCMSVVHPEHTPCWPVENREGHHGAYRLQRQPALNLRAHRRGLRRTGGPERQSFAVLHSGDQLGAMVERQGHKLHVPACERDRLDGVVGRLGHLGTRVFRGRAIPVVLWSDQKRRSRTSWKPYSASQMLAEF